MNRRRFIQFTAANVLGARLLGTSRASRADSTEELDRFGGWKGKQFKATGFFRAEHDGSRWWLVTPEGNAFFAVSLSHLYSGESNVACQNVYGGDTDAWLKGSLDKAREMGFNCALGSATSPERNLNALARNKNMVMLTFAHGELPVRKLSMATPEKSF